MSAISTYSTTAANNNSASPNGFPENMAPSGVNNSNREVMAATRVQHEAAEWIDLGLTPTDTSTTTFTLIGDQTAQYNVGRRVKLTDSSTLYGVITISAFTSLTTVTVVLDSGSISGSLTAVALGILSGTNQSIPAVAGPLSVDDTTDSTSGTTGSIHTDGGIGAVKDIVTDANFKPLGNTNTNDAAAMGYQAAHGLILTGQGSTNDVIIRNDAAATVLRVPTGTQNIIVQDVLTAVNEVIRGSDNLYPSLLQTEKATTSGTTADFTGLPLWIKKLTIMLDGFSTNGTSIPIIQLGDAGGFEATGYIGSASQLPTTTVSANHDTGFLINGTHAAANIYSGSLVLTLMDATNHTWVISGGLGWSQAVGTTNVAGVKDITTALTQIRLTTVNGTDTFDAGAFNIMWE